MRPFLGFGGHLVANHVINHVNLVADIFIGNRLDDYRPGTSGTNSTRPP